MADFGVSALEVSHLSAMYFYANIVFLIPAGILLDRFSNKKVNTYNYACEYIKYLYFFLKPVVMILHV